MNNNKGKAFEQKFKEDWKQCFPGTFMYRLKDQLTGYKETSKNPCDYICFVDGKLFLIECKSHKGTSIPFSAISQYERLLEYKNIENVYPGIIIWFIDKDKIIWVPIEEVEKVFNSGVKSISVNLLKEDKYKIIDLPTIKKKVYMKCDYTPLVKGE